MIPFILWGVARVGSNALGNALGALGEPFNRDWRWNWSSVDEIEKLCTTRQPIRHIYEGCPDDTNRAIAEAANRNGYRHVHLVRCNELARLVSRGIALQQAAWIPATAAARYADLKSGKTKMEPLDIEDLLKLRQMGIDRWRAVSPHLGTVLTVRFEDITAVDRQRRHHALGRLASYLGFCSLQALDHAMMAGGQHTNTVWDFVPNIKDLRQALEGVR
jgi:hypothetical protein